MPKAVIIGTGGHAQVIWAACQTLQRVSSAAALELVGWLEHPDYEGPNRLLDLPVFPETEAALLSLTREGVHAFYFGIGMVKAMPARWDVFQRLQTYGLKPETLIHPTAIVDVSALVEPGCFIGAHSVIQPFVQLGAATIVNTGSVVEHHACVGPNVHLAPGSILCGDTRIGPHSLIGAGSIVLQQVCVGSQVTVGAGSVLLQSVENDVTVVGNPARTLSKNVYLSQESAL